MMSPRGGGGGGFLELSSTNVDVNASADGGISDDDDDDDDVVGGEGTTFTLTNDGTRLLLHHDDENEVAGVGEPTNGWGWSGAYTQTAAYTVGFVVLGFMVGACSAAWHWLFRPIWACNPLDTFIFFSHDHHLSLPLLSMCGVSKPKLARVVQSTCQVVYAYAFHYITVGLIGPTLPALRENVGVSFERLGLMFLARWFGGVVGRTRLSHTPLS